MPLQLEIMTIEHWNAPSVLSYELLIYIWLFSHLAVVMSLSAGGAGAEFPAQHGQ